MSVEPAGALPETGVWQIDSGHSLVTFSVRHHAVATFRSSFSGITGTYDAATGVLTGDAPVDSLGVGIEQLKGHLLSPDFFDAANHPTVSFTSAGFHFDGTKLSFDGELTLRGVTKPISGTGEFLGPLPVYQDTEHASTRLAANLSAVIDRREFGVEFNNPVADGILNLSWNVEIDATLELIS